MVEKIQEAVMGYYGQFETSEEEAAAASPESESEPEESVSAAANGAEPHEIEPETTAHGTEEQAAQSVRIEAEEPGAESH
jgi:hypothetical protein